jgi:hypothetical protein
MLPTQSRMPTQPSRGGDSKVPGVAAVVTDRDRDIYVGAPFMLNDEPLDGG